MNLKVFLTSATILAAVGATAWLGMTHTWCKDRIIRQFPSPNGDMTVTLFAQDCGLEEEHIALAVSKPGTDFDNPESNLVWCSDCGTDDVSVQWSSDGSLRIDWPSCAPWNLIAITKDHKKPSVSYGDFAERKIDLEGHWTKIGNTGESITLGKYSAYSAKATIFANDKQFDEQWGADGIRLWIGNRRYKYSVNANILELTLEGGGVTERYKRQ